jgi:arylsulfatase A-like enzyme
MIVIDDMKDSVGGLGGYSDVETPNVDRLSSSGTLLTNAHP